MIEVVCHSCAQSLRVREEHAGAKIRCKRCGNVLSVPTPGINDSNDQQQLAANPTEAPVIPTGSETTHNARSLASSSRGSTYVTMLGVIAIFSALWIVASPFYEAMTDVERDRMKNSARYRSDLPELMRLTDDGRDMRMMWSIRLQSAWICLTVSLGALALSQKTDRS
jgi:hypothetical protein